MTAVDDYLMGLAEPDRAALEHVRRLVTTLVPDATEGVSYGMPALRYRGRPLLGFRSTQEHLSLFPFSPQAIDAVNDRLAGFSLSKGTIRFTAARPIPDGVLCDVIRFRVEQIAPNG